MPSFHTLHRSAFKTIREEEAFCLAVIVMGSRLMEHCGQDSDVAIAFQEQSMDLMMEAGIDFRAMAKGVVENFLKPLAKETDYDA